MQLYKPIQHRLSAYCRVVAGSEEEAFDLIQETLVAAFESFDKLRESKSFQFFLFAIARNCHLKQKRRNKFFGKQSDIKPANLVITTEKTELLYDAELLHKSIARLKGEQQEVILMFYIMGFSINEIAQHLSISEAAVKNRLVRGRDKLREYLSDKETLSFNRISANQINTVSK